jgi:flagellar protein FlaF
MGYAQAAHAYATLDPALTSPKRAEARVFTEATRRLRAAFDDGDAPMSQRAHALNDNRRLWMAVAVEAADAGNPMPDELRAGLISLAGFVERQTSAVFREGTGADILIEINASVIAGLSAGGA